MLSHPRADWLKRLMFQLKIFRYEFIDKRPIVYVDESGFAVIHQEMVVIAQKYSDATPVEIDMQEVG